MNKNIIISFIAGAIILFVLLLVVGNSEETGYSVTPALETNSTEVKDNGVKIDSDMQAFRDSFMEECATDPAYRAYCTCAYDILISKYTYKELIVMAGRITDENMPEELIDAASMCIDKL